MAGDSETLVASDSPEARREFLKKCGRFAAVTPPSMALLLSVSAVPREAHASQFGKHPKKPKKNRWFD